MNWAFPPPANAFTRLPQTPGMPIPSRPISLRATSPLTSPIWHGLVILPISPPMRAGSIELLSKTFAQSKSSVTLFLTALIPASRSMPSIWLSGAVSLTPASFSTPTTVSNTPRQRLPDLHFRQSMSRKDDLYDNAAAENFFSCLKCECVHLRHFSTRKHAMMDIFAYIEAFYNPVRPHSSIGWRPPDAFATSLSEHSVA